MTDRVKELDEAWMKARRAKDAVEARRMEREYELMRDVRAKLDAEFGVERAATFSAEREASLVLEAEKDRVRELESLSKLPYPVGTVLVEWGSGRYLSYHPEMDKLTKTGNRAVLQLYKQGDPLPGNVRWSIPKVGELVLRSLRKDGTPGAAVDVWRAGHESKWLPEGVEPKKKA